MLSVRFNSPQLKQCCNVRPPNSAATNPFDRLSSSRSPIDPMYLFTFARCIFRFGFVALVVVVLVVVEVVEVDVDVVVVAVFAAFNLNLISRFSDISDIERFWANE